MKASPPSPETMRRSSGPPPVCGIVVTFFPDTKLQERIEVIGAECDHVVVVDNGSPAGTLAFLAQSDHLELLVQSSNVGLAAAFNVGLRRALLLGYKWAVTFDQDSEPVAGMVKELWLSHERNPGAAVIGPCIEEAGSNSVYRWVRRHPRCGWFFQRVECGNDDLTNITLLISSGSLTDLEMWSRLGGFDEDFFIDYVDSDYCLKVLRSGRGLVVSALARMRHRLGGRRTGRFLGRNLRPMHHATFRHYYMARNRVKVWRRHAWAVPHWASFDLAFVCLNSFRVVIFEPSKWKKFKATLLGTWDGVKARNCSRPEYRPQV